MGFLEELKEKLNACADEDYQIHQRKRAYNLLKFLEDNKLLSKTSKLSTATFSDDFELYGSDLTDEGDELYDTGVMKWYESFDRGQSADNIKILEKYLKKIRSKK
jgi:hypothetical protein